MSIGNLLDWGNWLFTEVINSTIIVSMGTLQFRIRELMAEKRRLTGEAVTYETITDATGISPNTLSLLANNKTKMVGISVIERLLDYFGCDVDELMVYNREGDGHD